MEDVLAVYERPYNPAEPVVCLDEKPIVLRSEVRPAVAAAPGRVAQRDSEYGREGTANVFCAVEPKVGKHFTFPTPDRSAPELAQVLERILRSYRDADTVHLVMDNLNIHCAKTLTDFYGEELGSFLWSRFTAHYTPKHGSWLNQAEIEISLFARQCLGKRRIPNLATVRRQASAWNRQVNRRRVKIDWQFSRRKARLVFGYEPHSFTRSEY